MVLRKVPLFALAAIPAGAAAPVTYYQQIAPIIYHNCSACHRPGESAPFSLLGYEDVKRRAAQIGAVTKKRYMPPWLPEHGYGEFADERRLTDEQIQLIQDWVKQGAPAGSAAHAPQPPKFKDEWQLGTPDLVLRADRPYHLAPDGQEVFWNFILPVPITTTRWIKAVEVRPGNSRAFHHANVIIDRSHSARRHEIAPGAGFPGMDLSALAVEEETFDPDGHFLSWKPGSPPVVEPDGMSWRASPGMDLVLNVHMRPTGKPETVSPTIGLYFTGKPRTQYPMLVQLEHDGALDIPAGDKDFLVTDEFRTPLDLNVLAIYPHAHYLGKLLEAYATLPDGTRRWLVRIPDWDLSWQGVFRYRKPVFLPKGSLIEMRYHYDNSADNVRNPNSPPKEVKAGNQATDEMGHFWLQVLPVQEGDQRATIEDAIMRRRLTKYPGDFTANYILGDLMLTQGNRTAAIPYFEAAAAADPTSVVAATELGVALFGASRLPEAEQQFRRALEIDRGYTDARFDLASVEAARAEWEAAANDFAEVLKERPENGKARRHLGDVLYLWADDLAKAGNAEEALNRYRGSLEFRGPDAEVHTKMALMLARLGRLSEADSEVSEALKLDANFQPAHQLQQAVAAKLKER